MSEWNSSLYPTTVSLQRRVRPLRLRLSRVEKSETSRKVIDGRSNILHGLGDGRFSLLILIFFGAEPRSGDEAVEVGARVWWLLGGDQDGSGSTWFLR